MVQRFLVDDIGVIACAGLPQHICQSWEAETHKATGYPADECH